MSSRDPPFMSLLVTFSKQRKEAIQKGNTEASLRLIDQINKLIRDNQLNAVKQEIGSQKPDRKDGGLMQIASLRGKKQKIYPKCFS